MTTAEHIRERIKSLPKGEPFTSASLLGLGTRASVDQTLSRLMRSGELMRVARGVYVRPKTSRFVGAVTPKPWSVVSAMVEESGEKIGVHGAEAARMLGLTTQVPTKTIFLTTGRSRSFLMGERRVELRHVPSRRLILTGRPAGTALSALWYLGKEQVNSSVLATIERELSSKEFAALCESASHMPAWMSDALFHYRQERTERA